MRQSVSIKGAVARVLFLNLGAALLGACGGTESGSATSSPAVAPSQSLSLSLSPDASPAIAQPSFHLAPVLLEEPEDLDRMEPATSATLAPHRAAVNAALAQLSTRRLTRQIMKQLLDTGSVPDNAIAKGTETDPMASTAGVTVYTPAQVRAAYGLPAIPNTSSSVTSAQAAQLGAGQTIYILDAYDDPNAAAELAAFNSKFGLPVCKLAPVPASAALPLAAASAAGCVFSVVYATSTGAISSKAPAYDSGWATEIALDVQWAHAIAPYARIVLVESPDPTVTSFFAAAHLINTMGPGVVSMSFGSPEGGWTSSYDANFTAPNMTYFAATGDAGAEVIWPAVSANVVAVAGTSLTYPGTGSRSESVWSGTGGGVSGYVAAPAYQNLPVPGLNRPVHRQVADVAFNADPYTGQYIAVIAKGSTSPAWLSAGGTSLATPQWAAIVAVANAIRSQSSIGSIGAAQTLLYGLATQQGSYASNFLDVTKGSDGVCSSCAAGVGYDLPSGLGTPNVASLLPALAGPQVPVAPAVSSASVTGKVGVALSFAVSASATHALTYALNGAPTGMSINAGTGTVSWSSPVLGTYAVLAQAYDAQTGLSGQGTISVSIIAPQPPKVAGGSVSGVAQTALNFTTQVADANVVTYSLSGAPSGMAVSAAGVVSWAAPVAGTYAVTVTARDSITGLSGQGLYSVTITPQKAPVVTTTGISGSPGKALSFLANVPWSNPLTFNISGAPAGLSIASSSGLITWNSPVAGTYQLIVAAKDTKTGLTGTGLYTVTISASGPIVQATTLTGVAGKALSGSVAITDTDSHWAKVTINGMPAGMTVLASSSGLTFKWSSPLPGSYALQLTVVDAKSQTGTGTIPVMISAH